jgi:hypothetical protein
MVQINAILLKLQDFGLSNVMVYLCELLMISIVNAHGYDRTMKIQYSGRVTGFINFEAATIAPLWECAVISSHNGYRIIQMTQSPIMNADQVKTDIFCALPCFQWIPADTWSG